MSAKQNGSKNGPAKAQGGPYPVLVVYSLELDLKMGEVVAGLVLQSYAEQIGVSKWWTVGPYLKLIVTNPVAYIEWVKENPEWAMAQSITRITEAS